jgi:hypothetical protein
MVNSRTKCDIEALNSGWYPLLYSAKSVSGFGSDFDGTKVWYKTGIDRRSPQEIRNAAKTYRATSPRLTPKQVLLYGGRLSLEQRPIDDGREN